MESLDKWLDSLALGQYAAVFREHAIDEEVLPDLTDADLRELGLPLGHRKKLLKAISALSSDAAHRAPPAGSVEPVGSSARISKPDAERRQLTVMFCDLVGSTALSGALDLEAYRELLSVYQSTARHAIDGYEGYIARYMGDGLLVYFGYPTAHEDDAERAVRAGLRVVEGVSALSVPGDVELRVRVGIATGLVVAGDIVGDGASEEHAVLGETPNLAARLQGVAGPNEVIVAESTHRLVRGRFDFDALPAQSLKGIREPVRAYRVSGIKATTRFEAATSGGISPFVGRQSELRLLVDRWAQAKSGEGQVVLISGEPGIGKSRLLRELRDVVEKEPHGSLSYQCSPFTTKTAFAPIIEAIQNDAELTPGDSVSQRLDKLEMFLARLIQEEKRAAPLIAALLSLSCDRYPPLSMTPQRQKIETISTLVAMLEGAARRQPLLVLVEDVHWMDPSTLETFDAIVERTQTLPALVVMTHRPEFEPHWGRFGHVARHSLTRLNRADVKRLSERVTGGRLLPHVVLEEIVRRTDGVPLFVEELTKTVLEGGWMKESEGALVLDGTLPPLAIPVTLQDSLMARLDRLSRAKEVAQAAACIGREFSIALLSRILTRSSLEEDVERLVDAGLIFRRGVGHGESYIFKHALVQDVAYENLLVSKRRQLHAEIARALENSGEVEPGTLARHYSAAGFTEQAASCFLAAGRRALAVSALAEARGELEMGLLEVAGLAPSPVRDRLELDLRMALGAARLASFGWPHPSVVAAYEPAFALAEKLEDEQALGPILWGICVHFWCRAEFPETHHWLAKLDSAADRSGESEFAAVRDMTAGCQYFWEADYERAYQYTVHIREIYDESRHARICAYTNHDPLCFSLHWAGSLLQWIIGYPERALELASEAHALARRIDHPFNSAFALTAGSEGLLMRGDTDYVLRCCDEAQKIVDQEGLGDFAQHVLVDNWRGRTLTRLSDFKTGYRLTNLATSRWREAEGRICSALFWGGEAIALAGLGCSREALELIDLAIAHCRDTGDRFMEPEVLRVKAELLLAGGGAHGDTAESLLLEALEIARNHGAKSWELRVASSLARLWRSGDKRSEARELLGSVYAWFTEGFGTADLREARVLMEELS